MAACLSDLRLDELLTGELAAGDAATAADHVAGCERCRAREHALTDDRERFHAALPSIDGRSRQRPGRPRWHAAVVGAGAAAAAAVIALAVLPRDDGGTRTKGRAHLGFVVRHGDAMRVGEVGEVVHPGDTLTYLVTTAEPAYVTVLGRDAAGRITTYVPTDRVPAGRDVELSIATLLDDTLGREDIVAVFCAGAAPVRSVDEPPAGCMLDRLTIDKVP